MEFWTDLKEWILENKKELALIGVLILIFLALTAVSVRQSANDTEFVEIEGSTDTPNSGSFTGFQTMYVKRDQIEYLKIWTWNDIEYGEIRVSDGDAIYVSLAEYNRLVRELT